MKRLRLTGTAALLVAAAGSLTGCEVTGQFGATCTTSPPVPHQDFGVVEVDIEVPPEVARESAFTIRVDWMTGYPNLGPSGSFPTGVLSVTGPVTPSGNFSVGQSVFGGGSPYPNTLEFTVTGHPHEQIRVGAVSGSSVFGQFPDGYLATCSAGDAQVATIPIVARL